MAVYDISNGSDNGTGNAPTSATVGDTVITSGGNYQVVAPGTPGASYNPSSGFWSTKLDTANPVPNLTNSGSGYASDLQNIANQNTQQSQDFPQHINHQNI